MFKSLSFSEKSAWVMCPALIIASVFYLGPVLGSLLEGQFVPPPGMNVIRFIVILILLAIIGHIIAALMDVRAAEAPSDERDREVRVKVEYWSGLLFGFVTLMGLVTYFILRSGDMMFHIVFTGLILSHIISSALTILAYRGHI